MICIVVVGISII